MTPRRSGSGHCSSFAAQTSKGWIGPKGAVARTSRQVFARTVGPVLETSSSCPFKEQQQVADGEGGRRTRSNGGPQRAFELANSGSCLLHDKHWREQQSPREFQNREVVERRDTPRVARTPIDRSWPTLAKPTLASVSVLVVWPTLAKTDFGQTDFGQTDFGQTDFDLCVCVCVFVCVFVCVCVCL